MGYTMGTDGSVVLPAEVEADAFDAAGAAMAPLQGWYPTDGDPDAHTLDDLARFVGAALTRDGDRLVFGTDEEGDPKWSDQATAFYLALASHVTSGEVRFVGEDGLEWRYRYENGSLRQRGINGWDGSSTPFGPPAELAPEPQEAAPTEPAERRPSFGASSSPSSRLGLSPAAFGLLVGAAVLVILLLAL